MTNKVGLLFLFWVVGALLLSSCVAVKPPSSEELAILDYGPYPENYEEITKAHFEGLLIDPYSAHYYFMAPPYKFWDRDSLNSPLFGGWMVRIEVNSKNRLGGYTGREPYGVLIYNNQVIKVFNKVDLYTMGVL